MVKYILALGFVLFFTGCIQKTESVEKIFQTSSATKVKKDYMFTIQALKRFKVKLDKRNPRAFNPKLTKAINAQMDNLEKKVFLPFLGNRVENYKDYLQLAFSKDTIKYRNDYLILGLYYAIYDAYDIESGHQFLAMTYSAKKLENLHKNLQLVKWKIKYTRDIRKNYLYLTWQNNWQVELEKRVKNGYKPSWKELQNLTYIKNGQETLFDASNFSYEVLLTQMTDSVGGTLETLVIDPEELSIDVLKTLFMFI